MRNLNEQNVTQAVTSKLADCGDERLKRILTSLIEHLHEFVREVEPSEEEWLAGIQFLTAVGQKCDDVRQEFILLSDVLGVTILVDAINHRAPAGATESSVLGPFYQEGAPDRGNSADIRGTGNGEKVTLSGKVSDAGGQPIAGACLDVWQTAPNGLYHMQDGDAPEFNLCGKFHTDENGLYSFTTLKPVSYSIPTDGPVGKMLEATGRSSFRPAHIHFIVSAPGHQPVVTQLFTEGDPYLEDDAVFGVKNSLVVDYQRASADAWQVEYDFGLIAETN